MEVNSLVLLILIILFAATIHGVSGFAFGMVLVAFLPYVIHEYVSMLSMVSFLSLFATSFFAFMYRKYIQWKWLVVPVLASVLTNFIAISILNSYRELAWSRYLGGCLIALGLYMIFFHDRIVIKPSIRNGIIAGGLGGTIGGFFSVGGPPAVIYFLSISENNKYKYIGTTQMYFMFICCFDLLFRFYYDMVQFNIQIIVVPGILSILIGLAIGSRLLHIISPSVMKILVYFIIIVNGFWLLVKG